MPKATLKWLSKMQVCSKLLHSYKPFISLVTSNEVHEDIGKELLRIIIYLFIAI